MIHPQATIRRSAEDFVVDEIPAYAASGVGEHLFVTFTKRGLTTIDAVRSLARILDVDPRGTGYAGMKDRHAITTQTASFPFPIARDLDEGLARLRELPPGLTVLEAKRHVGKLKPGHLTGNRFTIVLRDIDPAQLDALCAALVVTGERGAPNAFGPQRFGRDGSNPERALAWLAGKTRGPRDKREQRLIFSALQSQMFNDLLDRRVAAGTWAAVLPGDIAKKHDSGGIFGVPLEGPELDDAVARAAAGALSATGPMFGSKMRWPEGEPLVQEREVLTASGVTAEQLEAFRHLGEGTRRPLRLMVDGMTVTRLPADASMEGTTTAAPADSISVSFVLPKGGFATTVLAQACKVVDCTREGPRGAASEGDAPEGDAEQASSSELE